MTMDIFHRLRQAFGNEECEYCGRLFHERKDYDQHVRVHTGMSILINPLEVF